MSYGQLHIEKAKIEVVEDDIMDQIFDFMVRDFSKFALQLDLNTTSTEQQLKLCLNMIKKPEKNLERFNRVWEKHIAVLDGAYEINP